MDWNFVPACSALARSCGAFVDGIVGHDLLKRYVMRIDFDSRTLALFEPEKFDYDGPGTTLPLEVRKGVPVMTVRFGLPGKGALEGKFLRARLPHHSGRLPASPASR